MITKQTIFSCAELADSIRTFLTADTLLLDIETTGLSAARHFIYCIGCSYLSPDKSDSITVQLFFGRKTGTGSRTSGCTDNTLTNSQKDHYLQWQFL